MASSFIWVFSYKNALKWPCQNGQKVCPFFNLSTVLAIFVMARLEQCLHLKLSPRGAHWTADAETTQYC